MMFNIQTICTIIATLVAVSTPTSAARLGHTHRRARQTCTDKAGWHDAGGKEFDCAWYADTVNACIDYGADEEWRNFGLIANDACCACGGGDRTTTAHPQPNTTNSKIAGQQCGVDILESSLALTKAVNDHRARNGKPRLPISVAMIATAQAHVKNLEDGGWNISNEQCNMHSWLQDVEGNRFDSCCFTSDFTISECMWDKPSKVTASWAPNTNGCQALVPEHKHNGFEISHWSSNQVTIQSAVNGWQESGGHRAVMLSEPGWEQFTKAIGCAMGTKYAHCWFIMEDANQAVNF